MAGTEGKLLSPPVSECDDEAPSPLLLCNPPSGVVVDGVVADDDWSLLPLPCPTGPVGEFEADRDDEDEEAFCVRVSSRPTGMDAAMASRRLFDPNKDDSNTKPPDLPLLELPPQIPTSGIRHDSCC